MSIVVFEHHPTEGPAALGSSLRARGHRMCHVKLYDGHTVPVDLDEVDGIISMGGPMNVDQEALYPWLEQEMQYLKTAHVAGLPIVGVCLGAQLIASALGGHVRQMPQPEIGWHSMALGFAGTQDPVYAGMGWQSIPFHIHGQEVARLPAGATPLAGSALCAHQAFKVGLTTYGFQYHFEWSMRDLEVVVTDPFIAQAGLSGQKILNEAKHYYGQYRRLGDRLCQTIAANLFPVDNR